MSGNLAHSPRFSSAAALMRHYAEVRRRVNSWAPPTLCALPSPAMVASGIHPVPIPIERPKPISPPAPRILVVGEYATAIDIIPNQRGVPPEHIEELSPEAELVAIRRAIRSYFAVLATSPLERRRTLLLRDAVASAFKISTETLLARRNLRTVVRPRQIAMALADRLIGCSLPENGRAFGGRDHTTVLHAVRKMKDLVEGVITEMYDGQACQRPQVGAGDGQ